ncbi:related to nucleoside transporter [Ramularia collo-cygni]|uniref:Related to nucleoside transporter n=1 Tax=Ramularia collo-cygni TaxID=112498 RepID=A0A2D3UT04_9PEZI|nr:related to nucleoside transporter [Ramularia collo-cygni]CZT14887.1 related to nucleoside transporter [Ramularia collo-cygni]
MDRLRKLFTSEEQQYEALENSETERDGPTTRKQSGTRYVEYGIFLLLGISMLWAWNMFLAAGPYFQHRFRGNQWIFDHFQAAEITVSTVTSLSTMLVLTRLQANASYPKRIVVSLVMNMALFALLAASTAIDTSAEVYFGFLMITIFSTSVATGLCQNGVFAYVSGFGEPKFTQGIMTGQAVAGVLPCIAQILSVLSIRSGGDNSSTDGPAPPGPPLVQWTAALSYFLTATIISTITLLAFGYLLARNQKSVRLEDSIPSLAGERQDRKSIPLLHLLRKLIWLSGGVFVTFAVTMVFPVFTQRILSVRPPAEQPPILQPPSFIPLALLFWNIGDLTGRLITAIPSLSLVLRPRVVFTLAVARIVFVGLYHLCNLRGEGAIVNSDFFYLVIVQLLFGLSNGYIGSTCMIGAGVWVDEEEREAAGGFMGLCLVSGLTFGSVLSFFIT